MFDIRDHGGVYGKGKVDFESLGLQKRATTILKLSGAIFSSYVSVIVNNILYVRHASVIAVYDLLSGDLVSTVTTPFAYDGNDVFRVLNKEYLLIYNRISAPHSLLYNTILGELVSWSDGYQPDKTKGWSGVDNSIFVYKGYMYSLNNQHAKKYSLNGASADLIQSTNTGITPDINSISFMPVIGYSVKYRLTTHANSHKELNLEDMTIKAIATSSLVHNSILIGNYLYRSHSQILYKVGQNGLDVVTLNIGSNPFKLYKTNDDKLGVVDDRYGVFDIRNPVDLSLIETFRTPTTITMNQSVDNDGSTVSPSGSKSSSDPNQFFILFHFKGEPKKYD